MIWSARACFASSLRDFKLPVLWVPINTVSLCQGNNCQNVITSHVCNAQDPCRTALNHSAIVGEKRRSTGDRARSGTIRDRVALSTEVGAGLEMRRKIIILAKLSGSSRYGINRD